MKKTILYHIFPIVILLAVLSCGKLPQNGDFDGSWQLLEITETGKEPVNVKSQQRFWVVQLDLMELRSPNSKIQYKDSDGNIAEYSSALCRFKISANTLTLSSFYLHDWWAGIEKGDVLVTNPETDAFEPYGIKGIHEIYTIEKMTSSSMILVSENYRLAFRKF